MAKVAFPVLEVMTPHAEAREAPFFPSGVSCKSAGCAPSLGPLVSGAGWNHVAMEYLQIFIPSRKEPSVSFVLAQELYPWARLECAEAGYWSSGHLCQDQQAAGRAGPGSLDALMHVFLSLRFSLTLIDSLDTLVVSLQSIPFVNLMTYLFWGSKTPNVLVAQWAWNWVGSAHPASSV